MSHAARASRHEPEALAPASTWPHHLSHEPLLRVSDVLGLVSPEFPTLTPSKLRFLDNHGLVSPLRTSSGYRQYSPADVERLRFVLRQQRDHFTPLAVIGEKLAALDDGSLHEAVLPHVSVEGGPTYLDAEQLARAAGTSVDVVNVAADAGLLGTPTTSGFPAHAVEAVVTAHGYLHAGGDARTLRALVRAAGREAELAAGIGAPRRARGDVDGAAKVSEAFAEAAIAVFAATVRSQATS